MTMTSKYYVAGVGSLFCLKCFSDSLGMSEDSTCILDIYGRSVKELLKLEWNRRTSELNIQNCRSLQFLEMSYNRITVLHVGALAGLENLQSLILQSNFIEEIAVNAFRGLDKLVLLDLTANHL